MPLGQTQSTRESDGWNPGCAASERSQASQGTCFTENAISQVWADAPLADQIYLATQQLFEILPQAHQIEEASPRFQLHQKIDVRCLRLVFRKAEGWWLRAVGLDRESRRVSVEPVFSGTPSLCNLSRTGPHQVHYPQTLVDLPLKLRQWRQRAPLSSHPLHPRAPNRFPHPLP